MAQLLTALGENRAGVIVMLASIALFTLLLNWVMWLFGWGRFKTTTPVGKDSKLRFVLANFFVEVVNDFRHLLALVIAFLFAVTLFFAMLPGIMAGDVAKIKDGIQGAAAALGGLMGSIIGYYFGESAASRRQALPPGSGGTTGSAIQMDPGYPDGPDGGGPSGAGQYSSQTEPIIPAKSPRVGE
jgi:hypothetical protein